METEVEQGTTTVETVSPSSLDMSSSMLAQEPVTSSASACPFQVPETVRSNEEAAAIAAIRQRIRQKEDLMRKLKLVQLYKKRWEKSELSELGDKWKSVAQAAILELYEKQKIVHQDLTIETLLQHFKIDPDFIGFNPDEETFA